MAKLTRSVLKGIVKECLVEILSEGLMGDQVLTNPPAQKKRKVKKPARDNVNPRFRKKINETTQALTQDPVMAAIFEDTARTTLQEQIHNESTPLVARHDLESDDGESEEPVDDILFEGSTNWSKLAFAEKKSV